MKIKNSVEPSTVPCGIPDFGVTQTLWDLFCRNERTVMWLFDLSLICLFECVLTLTLKHTGSGLVVHWLYVKDLDVFMYIMYVHMHAIRIQFWHSCTMWYVQWPATSHDFTSLFVDFVNQYCIAGTLKTLLPEHTPTKNVFKTKLFPGKPAHKQKRKLISKSWERHSSKNVQFQQDRT